ncbi:MAG: TetR/AcrR family transcriptional regulator [Sedimentisphaerales bacterium]|nr:TetR/AcrR family transcriptional regulator [Sedimentisphaerales bacterium]
MSGSMGRREREHAQRYNDILDAAEECFAEKGFHGTTVEDVANRAEFAVGTLYKFFSSKDELYKALIKERVEYLIQAGLEAMADVVGTEELVRCYIETKVRLCRAKPNFLRLYTRERMGDRFAKTELWREVVWPNFERLYTRLTEAFEAGIAEGALRDDIEVFDMVVALDNITDGFLFDALDDDDIDKYATKVEVMMRLFFDGVARK